MRHFIINMCILILKNNIYNKGEYMKKIEICKLENEDILDYFYKFFDSRLTPSIDYEYYISLSGHSTPADNIRFINDGYSVDIGVFFVDINESIDMLDEFELKMPLDLSYYSEIFSQANIIYSKNDFFKQEFKIPFTNSWTHFRPKRKNSRFIGFKKYLNITHNTCWKNDFKMIIKNQLTFVKIKLADKSSQYIPAITFSLPASKTKRLSIIISASADYEFMFFKNNDGFEYIDRKDVHLFMEKINTSIITYTYNSLVKSTGMHGVSLRQFKKFSDEERSRYRSISNMSKC